jgi:hypothetical protein
MRTLCNCTIILFLFLNNIVSLSQNVPPNLIINGEPQKRHTDQAPFSSGDCDIIDSLPSLSGIPLGIAWDGLYLWHSGRGINGAVNDLYQMDSLGNIKSSINYLPDYLAGLEFYNGYLWGVNEQSAKLYKIHTLDSTFVTYPLPSLSLNDPNDWGVTIGGGFIWISEYGLDAGSISALYKLDPVSATPIDTIFVNGNIMGIKWKDGLIFGTDNALQKLAAINPSNGTVLQAINWCIHKPLDLTIEGNSIWNVSAPIIYGGSQLIFKIHSDLLSITSIKPGKHNNNQLVSIYPNPANDELTITLLKNINTEGMVFEIVNAEGKMVKNQAINNSVTKINVADLISGLYIIRLISKDGIFINKLLKE